MPIPSYSDGTISITSGTPNLAGTGTAWSTQVKPGDIVVSVPLAAAQTIVGFVDTVVGDLEITLADDYNATTLSDAPYRIVRGISWWTGAGPNETLVQFLTELGPLGLAGASSGPPEPEDGRENQLHVDYLNSLLYQRRSGSWHVVASGFSFDAYGLAEDLGDFDDEETGFTYFATDEGGFYVKLSGDSADWSSLVSLIGPPGIGDKYTLAIGVNGKPAAGEVLLRHIFEAAVTFPEDLAASQAKADDASTGTAEFSITKNGEEVGTLVFDASDTGVFDLDGGASFDAGDILRVIAPGSQDATLANFSITLAGDR